MLGVLYHLVLKGRSIIVLGAITITYKHNSGFFFYVNFQKAFHVKYMTPLCPYFHFVVSHARRLRNGMKF